MIVSIPLAFALTLHSAVAHSAVGQLAWDALYSDWRPAGAHDSRGPCPMLNTFSNHGLLPRNGRNVTREDLYYAMGDGLGYIQVVINSIFDQALLTNPQPNATFFDLWHLGRPHALEHDASLSRQDAYFGNASTFHSTTFKQTTSYWNGDTLDPWMLTNSKIARQLQSRVDNPTYTFTENTEGLSIGELTSFMIVLGDWDTATAPRNYVEYFFENERLPTELGWTKPAKPITRDVIRRFAEIFTKTQSLIANKEGEHISLVTQQVEKSAGHSMQEAAEECLRWNWEDLEA